MDWNVTYMTHQTNVQNFNWKPGRKIPLIGPKRIWKYNNDMDSMETG
jgi:hypothetical protein